MLVRFTPNTVRLTSRLRELLALTTAAAVVSACASPVVPQRPVNVAEAALEQPAGASPVRDAEGPAEATIPVAVDPPAAEVEASPPVVQRAAPIRIAKPAIPEGPRRIGLQV